MLIYGAAGEQLLLVQLERRGGRARARGVLRLAEQVFSFDESAELDTESLTCVVVGPLRLELREAFRRVRLSIRGLLR